MPFDPISVTVSMALGAAGTLVTVLTYQNTIKRQKVKLTVTPAPGKTYPQGDPCVCVEVVNLSAFPITITDIGLNRRDSSRYSYSFLGVALTNGQRLPHRLESREAISAVFPATVVDINMATNAFATTSCGHRQEGDSPAWKQLTERADKTRIAVR
jgi:hypothetical protein